MKCMSSSRWGRSITGILFAKPLPLSNLIHASDYRKHLKLTNREGDKQSSEITTLQSLAFSLNIGSTPEIHLVDGGIL